MKKSKQLGQQKQLIPLSEGELAQLQLPPQQIWYLMINELSHGPYSLESLQDFLQDNPDFDRSTLANNERDEGWKALSEYPDFDLGAAASTNQALLLLINGRPCGPYTLKFIRRQVEQREILLNTLASEDQGKTWCKLYQHSAFDRRREATEKSQDFPISQEAKQLQERREQKLKFIDLSSQKKSFLESMLPGPLDEQAKRRRKLALGGLMGIGLLILSLALLQLNRQKFHAHQRPHRPLIPKIPLPTTDKDAAKPKIATPITPLPELLDQEKDEQEQKVKELERVEEEEQTAQREFAEQEGVTELEDLSEVEKSEPEEFAQEEQEEQEEQEAPTQKQSEEAKRQTASEQDEAEAQYGESGDQDSEQGEYQESGDDQAFHEAQLKEATKSIQELDEQWDGERAPKAIEDEKFEREDQ